MSLRNSLIGSFIVHEPAAVLLGNLFGFLFKCFEIAAVFLVIDFIIQRRQIRVFLCNIIHDGLLKTASQVQILQPYQITLILRLFYDCLDIRDSGEYGRNEADGTDAGYPCRP